MKVAILGCGPTGLIAAHAAVLLGHDVTIFSRKVKSETFGAMYLHEPIPGVTPGEPELEVHIVKLGTREGYARSVYGSPHAEVSWDKFVDGPAPAWDLAATYDRLWNLYAHLIVDGKIDDRAIERIALDYRVFSSLPTNKTICFDWTHRFEAVEIAIIHGPADKHELDVMYYNGLPSLGVGVGSWYRYSIIRGYQSWEYSRKLYDARLLPEGLRVDFGIKPLRTDCDCRPGIHRIGRFGKWDKHVFTHHAYGEVRNVLLQV